MGKIGGSLTVVLTVAAGLLLQSGRKETSGTSHPKAVTTTRTAQVTKGEGPWVASCRYWAAVEGERVDVTSTKTDEAASETLHGCESKDETTGWNIPSAAATSDESVDKLSTDITSMIAVVPDPIHSGLALDFDRTLESILLAAADNHYFSSYYWLPWQQSASSSDSDQTTDPPRSNPQRERQPGLVVLRYVPEPHEWPASAAKSDFAQSTRTKYSWNSYRKVVYLFLVAETPSLGINGEQLQNALHHERYLQGSFGARLSAQRGDEHILSVIGPSYSGTAASLYAGLSASLSSLGNPKLSVTGVTSTGIASHELDPEQKGGYRSFGENTSFEQDRFLEAIQRSGYGLDRVAILSESGTVYGSSTEETPSSSSSSQNKCAPRVPGCYRKDDEPLHNVGSILSLRFPRELSLLRNATASNTKSSSTAPTPYLGLSLKGDAADDTVERFSKTQTPLSIEAQLMAIANQLKAARAQFVLISASNILDDIFLAEFLHRACPDARFVMSSGGDLLFEREGENASYVGSISISPYLLSSLDLAHRNRWMHSDYHAEAIYNAATFAFQTSAAKPGIALSGYSKQSSPAASNGHSETQIPLWASVVGSDGYYPVGVLNWCSSDDASLLPSFSTDTGSHSSLKPVLCSESNAVAGDNRDEGQLSNKSLHDSINGNTEMAPALPWHIFVGLLCLICIAHATGLVVADLWSPFTRDLAIDQNDLPHRRAVYLNIGGSVLASMAVVTSYPLFRVGHYFQVPYSSYWAAIVLLLCGILVIVSTAWKTWRYFYHPRCKPYCFFNSVSAITFAGIAGSWIVICSSDTLYGYPSFSGLYHSVRCLQPFSGVSPLCPVVLVLSAWYLWAVYQVARLRFSHIHRPRLPRLGGMPNSKNETYPLFVPDEVLEACAGSRSCCLYSNVTCLLITRELVSRFVQGMSKTRVAVDSDNSDADRWLDILLGVVYVALFFCCLFLFRIHSLDTFVFKPLFIQSGPTMYEALLKALFFPLLMVALAGWLRTLCIWAAINRGLLEPLERMPIRFAFDRYKSGGWMSMLRQKGLHIRWRDMSRSTEAIRQMVHHPDLKTNLSLSGELSAKYQNIDHAIRALMEHIRAGERPTINVPSPAPGIEKADASAPCPSRQLWDMPANNTDVCSIFHIESGYADFATSLIRDYLADRWEQRIGPLEREASTTGKSKDAVAAHATTQPSLEHIAEDFIVIRYVALIRSVLLNMRYQMLTVGTAFVLALVAWNSYPFEPHAFMDWVFTLLLGALGVGFVSVFAQMHRSAILSRITDTTPNELGWDFYLRLITFGAVPVLTWIAYEFPQIGGTLYRLLQPGFQAMK